jgi:DNA phosphorothioation-associated putative methyltransferase
MEVLYEENRDLLEPLMRFFGDRGRLPQDTELEAVTAIRDRFGSIRRAFRVILEVTRSERWDTIAEECKQDLVVYLALTKFSGRPKFTRMATPLQLDIKALFKNYTEACDNADSLLFSVGSRDVLATAMDEANVGNARPNALYIHRSEIPDLPPVLRVYEGCANAYIGDVEGSNVVKLHRHKPAITYMKYADFERIAHPVLQSSLRVELNTFDIKMRNFSDWDDPPILHEKDLLVGESNPLKRRFSRLTSQERHLGLLDNREVIGTKKRWEALLQSRGCQVKGHRLVRM